MSNCNCECNSKYNCTDISIAASLLVGIIAAVLRYIGVITVTPVFLWVVFGIATAFLAITFLTYTGDRCISTKSCICHGTKALLLGILGAILISVILLAITFSATSIIGTILVGALLFFFSLLITSVACLIKCIENCNHIY